MSTELFPPLLYPNIDPNSTPYSHVTVLLSYQSNTEYICITMEMFPSDVSFVNVIFMETN